MYYTVFFANDVEVETSIHYSGEGESELSQEVHETDYAPFVVMHNTPEMLTVDVMQKMVEIWKKTLIPGEETPVITTEHSDATNAFAEWLGAQPYGYVVPHSQQNLMILPIFDEIGR